MGQDYNQTLNLPKTDFPMRAGLAKREPGMLNSFYERDIYGGLMERNKDKPLFILHDGPPFSNGDIHLGTAMNKIIKDFIVRYKNMSGFKSPYTPGWDNHGMPIESAIIKKNKLDHKNMTVPEFRDACRDFAAGYVDSQREQFKRLGVMGDWGNIYLTMDPAYEAEEIRVFGKMYENGYIYRGLKPVYWCPSDETALAEAEIEYADDPCTTAYVKFKVNGMDDTYFLIWTTTIWTLPGNLAICLNPSIEYSFVKAGGETYIVATSLVEEVFKKAEIDEYEIIDRKTGREMELMTARHPFYDRDSLVIVGDHVTTESGTGCVHTAPGFGVDDFNVTQKYPQIGMVVPVNDRGIMTDEALQYAGMHYSKANNAILEDMIKSGALFAQEHIEHSYPHCWRCKNPIIYRATEQWFASVDAIKDQCVEACEDITWHPAWGKERMIAMIKERTDWCISRQRRWGLPIPVFYCDDCEEPVCTPETTEIVAQLFEKKGSNAWYAMEADEILPAGFPCPHCGGTHFSMETDILDCWFDSGSSHAACLDKFDGLRSPADIYLEGGDQYRGWFQSSMLTSIAVKGEAPYRQVITHGWTVDGEGRAMHKSLGNGIAPEEIINQNGADLLRLWVASSDYTSDMRISKDIVKQLTDIYLKIRNTARYILGNLNNFDPNDLVSYEDMEEIDKWALMRLNKLVGRVRNAYEKYEYHTIYHGIHNFCAVDMSNFYLDVIKDRLYCDPLESNSGKSARTAIYLILDSVVRMLGPILAFTSEEIWEAMPHGKDADPASVLYNDVPQVKAEYEFDDEMAAKWEKLLTLRSSVNKSLELARSEKIIGKPLDAEIVLHMSQETKEQYEAPLKEKLSSLFIVSKVEIMDMEESKSECEIPGLSITVRSSTAPKCVRCWTHDDRIGENADHPELCPRCADVVG